MNRIPDVVSDRAIPGLGIALNLDTLFSILAERLSECRAGLQLLEGRAMDVQYAPGAGAQVLWRIRAHDPETARTGRQFIFVRALRADEAMPAEPTELIARYAELRASRAMLHEMPFRTAWLPIEDAHVIVHAFPLDPALPTLMTVASPAAMRAGLQRVWGARGAKVRRVRVDTLSYTPGARAAMQYEVLAEDRQTSIPELRRLVGKLDVRRSPARLFAGHWAVWRRTFGQVAIAPPVGYVAVARLSLQEFLTGTRLSDSAGDGDFVGKVRQAARRISRVHQLTLPLLRHRSVEKEMRSVERWADVLAGLRPAQADRLKHLSRRLRQELSGRMRITATIHADFHLANILADKHGVTLIDWDQVAHGDPMLDVGRFLASLRVSSLRLNGTVEGLAPVEDAFLEAYLQSSGDNEQRARLFEAASLLTAAAAPFRLQRDGWEEDADRMIREVERVLDLSLAGPRFAGTQARSRRQIPFEERPAWATDRVYARALLVPIVQTTYGADIEVTECEPRLRDSSRSRLHMSWSLKGYRGNERWRGSLEGVGFPGTSGRSILRRVSLLHAAAARDRGALQIARPLGPLVQLSMLAFEPVSGSRLDKLFGTPQEHELLDKLAMSLVRLQALDVSLPRKLETRRIVGPVARLVKALVRSKHAGGGSATGILSEVTRILATRGERMTAMPVPFTARQLRVDVTGMTVAPVHDALMADPLFSAASLLAELTVAGLESGEPKANAERFRSAYVAASGEPEYELAAWEALLLLRWACLRAATEPDSLLAPQIIRTAAALVETGGQHEAAPLACLAVAGMKPGLVQ